MSRIEVICSKVQYKMLIDALSCSGLYNGKCFLRKDALTCPFLDDSNHSCEDCLKKNIQRRDA